MLKYNGIPFEAVRGFRVYPFPLKKYISVLILSSSKTTNSGKMYHAFFLVNDQTGDTAFMFGCEVVDGYEAVELANSNAVDYLPIHWLKEADI